MGSDSIGLILSLVGLLILSAFFSATETAFSSLNRSRIKSRAENGDKKAQLVLRLSDQYDQLLSTILVGNNIVNIAMASIATVLFMQLIGDSGASVATIVVTVVVLIFGEISPKSLAKESADRFAELCAPVLRFLMLLLTPLNFLFAQWKKLLRIVFKTGAAHGVTEEELLTIVTEAEQDGGINAQEGTLIRNAIEFNERETKDILVPRVDLEAISVEDSKETIAATFRSTNFSRLPVYDGTIDHIVGILLEKDFNNRANGTDVPISSILKPAIFVSEGMEISRLMKLLQKNKAHMAVVADEYGGTVGIVTMEDILEELVGEIWDEHDEVIEEIQEIGPHQYRVRCTVGLDRLMDYFGIREVPEAATVNGWLMERLGKIPEAGDAFTYDCLTVEVRRVSERRAEELLITQAVPEDPTE